MKTLTPQTKKEVKEKIYLIDDKISWETFKILHDKLVDDSGPTPINGTKAIWELLRDKKLYCWFSNKMKGDMGIGLMVPPNVDIKLITNKNENNRKTREDKHRSKSDIKENLRREGDK